MTFHNIANLEIACFLLLKKSMQTLVSVHNIA